MLGGDEQKRAFSNCEKVRTACRVRSLQVLPDENHADNVRIRLGQGPWRTLHVLDALKVARNAYRSQRRNITKRRVTDRATDLRIAAQEQARLLGDE